MGSCAILPITNNTKIRFLLYSTQLDPYNYLYGGLNNCSSTLTLDQRSIGVLFFKLNKYR